jgi:hypothetical protein
MGEQTLGQDSDLLPHIEDDLRTGAAAWREPDLDVQEALKEYNAIYQRYEPGERPQETQHRVMELEQLLASRGYLDPPYCLAYIRIDTVSEHRRTII